MHQKMPGLPGFDWTDERRAQQIVFLLVKIGDVEKQFQLIDVQEVLTYYIK